MNSIHRRMLTLLFYGLVVVTLVASFATYLKAREEVDEFFDYQLVQVAQAVSRQQAINVPHASGIDIDEEDELSIQVWNDRDVISPQVRNGKLPPQREGLSTVSYGNNYWRVYVLHGGDRIFQISQPFEARQEISVKFALRVIIPLLVVLPFFYLIIWLSVRSGLRPLNELAEEIALRSASSLDPLPVDGLPEEISPLVSRLNLLLERLAAALDLQKRFVADAAHELRTPLSVVGIQLRILERSSSEVERHDAISKLRDGIDRAARMVNQLLVLARLEPEAPLVLSDVALSDLACEIVAERSGIAGKKGVDLGVTRCERITVHGEMEALRAIIANLVDNAINHTPAGGTIDVSVLSSDRIAIVEVVDTGPGIPPEERERVFDRFYRKGGEGCTSSGLGLAIVKSALERLKGTITLGEGEERKGLRVTVRLPLSDGLSDADQPLNPGLPQ
jgi:two-component system OmpR family sensor kinase